MEDTNTKGSMADVSGMSVEKGKGQTACTVLPIIEKASVWATIKKSFLDQPEKRKEDPDLYEAATSASLERLNELALHHNCVISAIARSRMHYDWVELGAHQGHPVVIDKALGQLDEQSSNDQEK